MDKRGGFALINAFRVEIMGFAALWIWFFHEWRPFLHDLPLLGLAERSIKRLGYYGVDFFLLLSGIGLCYAIGKYSTGQFYKKRLLKVYLPYAVFVTVKAVALRQDLVTYLKIVSGYSFLMEHVYSTLWFVPAILILYLFFPLYYRFFSRSAGKGRFTLGAILVWLALSVLLKDVMRRDLYVFTNRIPVFLTGVWIGWHTQNRAQIFSKKAWFGWSICFTAGLALSVITKQFEVYLLVPESDCCLPSFLMALSGCCLLGGTFARIRWEKRFLAGLRSFLRFFGARSLEFYCVQEWIGDLLPAPSPGMSGFLLRNLISFGCAVVGAILLKRLCGLITCAAIRNKTGTSANAS